MNKALQERNEALLSLNRERILSYYKKFGNRAVWLWFKQVDDLTFWGSVHKARTAITSLPVEAREASFKWLDEHGLKPYPGSEI